MLSGVDFNRRLGEHLRRIRKLSGLSLLDVEATSGQEFKASVVGAYERGDRAISAPRLARLAQLYGVPLRAMLPGDQPSGPTQPTQGVVVNLLVLEASDSSDAKAVARYARLIQQRRSEAAGSAMGLRAEDVRALAAALDRTPEDLVRRLEDMGGRIG